MGLAMATVQPHVTPLFSRAVGFGNHDQANRGRDRARGSRRWISEQRRSLNPSKTPAAMFLKSARLLSPRLSTTTALASKQPVKAETGCLSQLCTVQKAQTLARGHRSALLNPFSSPLRRTRRGPFTALENFFSTTQPQHKRSLTRLCAFSYSSF